MKDLNLDDYKGKRFHFIGVGGCSMNGLAAIMHEKGYLVTGSDRTASTNTKRLIDKGIEIHIGHDAENVQGADVVVYSAAIKKENPELAYALGHNILCLERAGLLGELSKEFKQVIGVAGCHGKTTITSMLALILLKSGVDATMHVGGEVAFIEGGTHVGSNDTLVTEACEYVESFLELRPTIAVVSNIDDDHLDYFRDIEHIYSAFSKFIGLLPQDGLLVANSDDELVRRLIGETGCAVATYGSKDADWVPVNIEFSAEGNVSFDCIYKGSNAGCVSLKIPGEHNVYNAIAAIAVAERLGVSVEQSAAALTDYTLTKRRFEYYGTVDDVDIFHDYAHHPNEIIALLAAASKRKHNRIWCVFQCNSYTRAVTLFDKYIHAFGDADYVLVPDIYPGREVDTGRIHARDLVAGIQAEHGNCVYLPAFDDIDKHLKAHWQPGDMVVALGSGDVFEKIKVLLK